MITPYETLMTEAERQKLDWLNVFDMIARAQSNIPGASEQALVALRFICERLHADWREQSAALQVVTQELQRDREDNARLPLELAEARCREYPGYQREKALRVQAEQSQAALQMAGLQVQTALNAEYLKVFGWYEASTQRQAALVEQIRALPRQSNCQITDLYQRFVAKDADYIRASDVDDVLTKVLAGADPASAQTE